MATCRSCGAAIRFIGTERGRLIPVDDFELHFIPNTQGDEMLVTETGRVIKGFLSNNEEAITGYRSHFATCPNADAHRKERKK